ncbi:uncharacterized protein METZ01_LOCUS436563, partial [marine metagenome]
QFLEDGALQVRWPGRRLALAELRFARKRPLSRRIHRSRRCLRARFV